MKAKAGRVVVIALTSLFLVLTSAISTLASQKTLKVGVIMPLSGPISMVGVGMSRTIELYFDKVNEEGGVTIDGTNYKLQAIVEDSKMDPAAAATAAKKLIYRDEVKFVFGAILPPVASAIYQVCARAKVLHVITWIDAPGAHGDVSSKKPYAIRPTISADAPWELNFAFMKKAYPNAKTVFWTVPDNELDMERAKRVTEAHGFTYLGHEIWQEGTIDFMPYLTKALAAKPDILYAADSAQSGDQLKTARQMGFKGVVVSDVPLAPMIIRMIAGKKACYDVVTNGMDFAHATPSMRESMQRWNAKYKEPYFGDAPVPWSEAEIFVQVLKKANSLDAKKIVKAFETMTAPGSFKTAFGDGHAAGEKRFGVNRIVVRPIPISRLMDGEIQFEGFYMPVVD